MLHKILEQPSVGRGFASELEGAGCPGNLKTGIDMSERRNSASSLRDQPTDLASHMRDRGDELTAQADLMLARYPIDVREQIAELLRVLVAKPGEAENQVR
jgi:hypothetical protein